MTPIQSAQEYVDSGCDQFSKEHIVALIAECERLEHENNQAAEAIELLIDGEPIGEIVGMHTIENQAREIEKLEAALAARKEQS